MSHLDDRIRVLVVGAGLAGLRCAELLQRSGVTVELHEATERVGGRCWSAHGLADGIVAEHGGELIAPDHLHVAALANELGLQLEDRMAATPPELRSGAIVFEGRRVGPGEGTSEMARVLAMLVQEAERIGDLRPGLAGDEVRRLDKQTVSQWLDEHVEAGTRSLTGRMIKTATEMAYGMPADRISGAALVYQFGKDLGCWPRHGQCRARCGTRRFRVAWGGGRRRGAAAARAWRKRPARPWARRATRRGHDRARLSADVASHR